MATVSVIIPAYNVENTIVETLYSVLEQTFTDFEIIVIDDGSQDNTVECVNSVTDDRIKLFSYKNGGLSTARNRGIDRATGDFITFLDADDLWTADKLELQLEALHQNPDAGVAYSWVAVMEADATGKYVFYPVTPYDFSGNVYVPMLLSNFMINGSNIMARREAITTTGYFAVIKSGEDWDYYIRLASQWQFTLVSKYQILYRRTSGVNSSNMSAKLKMMSTGILEMIDQTYQIVPKNLQKFKAKTFANYNIYCADMSTLFAKNRQDFLDAQIYFWKASWLNPQFLLNRHNVGIFLKSLLGIILPFSLSKKLLAFLSKKYIRNTMQDPRIVNNLLD